MNNPTIFQIYFLRRQRRLLDPAFTPYFNDRNERPQWREYWVFRQEYPRLDFSRYSHVGYLSWKFGQKCRFPGEEFLEFIRSNPGSDVYFVNPFLHDAYLYDSVWKQGEQHHPGMFSTVIRILGKVYPQIDFATLKTRPEVTAYCNYWCGNARFWKEYMAFCEPFFSYAEEKATSEERQFLSMVADQDSGASYHAYIMERMISSLLALRPDLQSRQMPLPELPVRMFYGPALKHLESTKIIRTQLDQLPDATAKDRLQGLNARMFYDLMHVYRFRPISQLERAAKIALRIEQRSPRVFGGIAFIGRHLQNIIRGLSAALGRL